jgi:glyoxalase family protein
MQLLGFHHLTAVTAQASENVRFYTRVLGLRLVKKTVNQDDVSAYHLFYGDGAASPGSDITFFDWPAEPERRGGNSVTRTGFRVPDEASLQWWQQRFGQHHVTHRAISERDGRAVLDFEDPEGQRLSLVMDDTSAENHPWEKSPVPPEHQILGLGAITLTVPRLERTERILTEVMGMRRVREYRARVQASAEEKSSNERTVHVYQMGGSGPAAELHVVEDPSLPMARAGAGGVHHVAFRTPTFEDYDAWVTRLEEKGIRNSGPIDRFYFRSLYFREPNGVLFEIATDGPGFATDEPMDSLGEHLALPPFLEGRRAEIERGLKPL